MQEKHAELERTNGDLRKQLQQDSRDSSEAETLRRQKIELDMRVKEMETLMQTDQERWGQQEEKLKSKLEKYKASLDEHIVGIHAFPAHITPLSPRFYIDRKR